MQKNMEKGYTTDSLRCSISSNYEAAALENKKLEAFKIIYQKNRKSTVVETVESFTKNLNKIKK